MGIFIDRGNLLFRDARRKNFVDKSGVIEILNDSLDSEQRFVCVSRPRRFGKTMAAKMIYAYYDRSDDSHYLFDDLQISRSADYETYLNKFPTIFIDWNRFSRFDKTEILAKAQKEIVEDLAKTYPFLSQKSDLFSALVEIYEHTSQRFVLIIDEWDMLIRDVDLDTQTDYVNFLRNMFKSDAGAQIFSLVYMTGILPIIKVETQSALNNFVEYSVVRPAKTAPFYGFVESEVESLCLQYNMDLSLMKHAYDGYIIGDQPSVFNPYSVIMSLSDGRYGSHWTNTAAFSAIETYITIDADNVRDKIIRMLNGESVRVKVTSFRNDMKNVETADDVLTLLVHLGYLSYDPDSEMVRIPNTEVAGEFENAVADADWNEVSRAIKDSNTLLDKTLSLDSDYVAKAFDNYRFEASSILQYNNENSIACAIRLAYFSAISHYKIFRELPSGKGFADMVFIPVSPARYPAIVVELKYDSSAQAAIDQIKNKAYPTSLSGFSKKIILVGISYDRHSASHNVLIEEI